MIGGMAPCPLGSATVHECMVVLETGLAPASTGHRRTDHQGCCYQWLFTRADAWFIVLYSIQDTQTVLTMTNVCLCSTLALGWAFFAVNHLQQVVFLCIPALHGANIFAVSVLAANIHFIPATEKLVVERGSSNACTTAITDNSIQYLVNCRTRASRARSISFN